MSSPTPSSDPRLPALVAESLCADAVEQRLDDILDPVLSTRRTATGLAESIAPLERGDQDFILHWSEVIARTNPEMAYQFAAAAPQGLSRLDHAAAEAWIICAMDTYDREGLYRGSAIFRNLEEFTELAHIPASTVAFEEVAQVLQFFLCGLSGRRLRLDTAAHGYTDTETIYLPARVALLPSRDQNFLIYKTMTTLLWAQSRFGTFDADLAAACRAYSDPERALEVLNTLETHRLEFHIAPMLPGLAREMRLLRSGELDPRCRNLAAPTATVYDSIALLEKVYPDIATDRCIYAAALRPERAAAVRKARIAREKDALHVALAQLLEQQLRPDALHSPSGRRFSVTVSEKTGESDDGGYALQLDGERVTPPDNISQLMESILQDLGEIPDDYLVAAGDGEYGQNRRNEHDPVDVWKGVYHEEGAFFYNEWDCKRRHYRKNWCVLREVDVHPGDAAFIDSTLDKYAAQVAQLKRTFELLRGEDRLLKRQPHGDDIDFDAIIAAYADMKTGVELSDRLLTKRHKSERDLAVMFMVDMSGSTKGWINDAEREALVMLCEALEVLGDRYAIYGFSGITRKRCEIFRVKRFDEPYDVTVKGRIAGIQPQDYTRMGAAIRHLTTLLSQVDARTKLMISLSDGKPDDYSDNYRGEYGVEDTRQALIEAHRSGIKPFCITIDREARDYLPHMYGPVNWIVIDDVSQLPLKVGYIYQRLTS